MSILHAIVGNDNVVAARRKWHGFHVDCSPLKVSCMGNRAETISSMHRLIKKPSAREEMEKTAARSVRFPCKVRQGLAEAETACLRAYDRWQPAATEFNTVSGAVAGKWQWCRG